MRLQTKLLLYFSIMSLLILMVGLAFYFQLKYLVRPLTPESVPQSVEKLSLEINDESIKTKLMIQVLNTRLFLTRYLISQEPNDLQAFYLTDSLLQSIQTASKTINPHKWKSLNNAYLALDDYQLRIINLIKKKNLQEAMTHFKDPHYQTLIDRYNQKINLFFNPRKTISSEEALINVKLAGKEAQIILEQSINTTLLIFFDALVASILLVIFSAKSIIKPINMLRQNIEQMDVETFRVFIHPDLLLLKGELGDLARSFSDLFHRLRAATVLKDELLLEIKRHEETEKKLQETAAQLHESNLELEQFSASASHDLRSPLRGIESLVTWIYEDSYDLLPPESQRNFELIKKRVQRLNALIQGLLEYSKASRPTDHYESVDLFSLLHEIVDTISPPPHIQIALQEDIPVVHANRYKMTQVFLNLITNAIKYNNKAQGKVEIGYRKKTVYYEFFVKDNGSGIESRYFDTIFEMFQTLQPRDVIEGTGLGLAIVKKIIEREGGRIWVKSKINVGSTFYFTWPIKSLKSD